MFEFPRGVTAISDSIILSVGAWSVLPP